MFNEFPYTNFHELNLDWIIQKVKEAYSPDNPPENIVLSVNGETGNVQLYTDPIVRFPDIDGNVWNIHRVTGNGSSGIQFTATKAQRIVGANRYDMYDSNNQPPYPVTSVNGQTGAINIVIPVQSVNGQTGAVVIPPDFQNSNEIMEFTQASDGNYWGLSRVVSTGTASIYLDTSNNTVKAYITYESTDGQTTVTLPLLTSADIPSSSGVLSINGKTGAVTLYGSDIYTNENSQTTVAQDLAANALTEQNIMHAVAILINGNTCATGAAAGQYVYLKDSTITGAADGLYKAAQAIPANTVIDVTYLTAVSAGGLNSLNDNLTIKDISNTIGVNLTRGTLLEAIAKKWGNVVILHLEFNPIASTTEGNSVAAGTITTNLPIISTFFEGSYSKTLYHTVMRSNGTFETFNMAGESLASHRVAGTFIYLTA